MKRIIYFFFLLLLFSCSNEKEVFEVVKPHFEKAIAQQDFDWENADFMPTPEGAEKIMSPWSGSGSLLEPTAPTLSMIVRNQRDGRCFTIRLRPMPTFILPIHSLFCITNTEA